MQAEFLAALREKTRSSHKFTATGKPLAGRRAPRKARARICRSCTHCVSSATRRALSREMRAVVGAREEFASGIPVSAKRGAFSFPGVHHPQLPRKINIM